MKGDLKSRLKDLLVQTTMSPAVRGLHHSTNRVSDNRLPTFFVFQSATLERELNYTTQKLNQITDPLTVRETTNLVVVPSPIISEVAVPLQRDMAHVGTSVSDPLLAAELLLHCFPTKIQALAHNASGTRVSNTW